MSSLPAPPLMGLPPKFPIWRPGQSEAVCRILDSPKRFSVAAMPTGFGKSLVSIATGVLDERTAYLTSTKGLADQLLGDFGPIGLADVRGMSNYECRYGEERGNGRPGHAPRCDEGPCLAGVRCDYRERGCGYFDAQRLAANSHLTVTNYAYWLAANREAREAPPLGPRGRLVLDEAHAALDELGKHLEITLRMDEIAEHLSETVPDNNIVERWMQWARVQRSGLDARIDDLRGLIRLGLHSTGRQLGQFRRLCDLSRRVQAISCLRGDWIVEDGRDRKGHKYWNFAPVWPGSYAESSLFLSTPKVVLTSATIRPKTLELLGVNPDEVDFMEYPSGFPVANRLSIWIPTVRITHKTDGSDLRMWVAKIDAILRTRGDRKGIIHTVSYARRDYLLRYSEFASRMQTHDSGELANSVLRFRSAGPGAVFVSPSVSTGFDFPLDECRYQIIGKVPFPDTRSRVLQARGKRDPDYFAYQTMQTLVQTCGRGVRSRTDWCENFIIDDNIGWFMSKYRGFAPRWFVESYRKSLGVPPARPLGR